jgi:hypothetical protein
LEEAKIVRTRSWAGRRGGGRGPDVRATDGPEETMAESMLDGSAFLDGLEELILED